MTDEQTTDVVEVLRSFLAEDKGRTHWSGCWRSHVSCAIVVACDEIEFLRERAEVLERSIDALLDSMGEVSRG